MIKKILPISIFILLVVVIVLLGVQNMSRKGSGGSSIITPTLIQGSKGGSYNTQKIVSGQLDRTSTSQASTQVSPKELQDKLPIIAPDFTLSYSPRMQKYVATILNDDGAQFFNDWLLQNPSYQNELENTIITKQTISELHNALDYAKTKELTPEKKAKEDAKVVTETLNTLINLPFLFMQIGQTTSTEENILSPTPIKQSTGPSPFPTKKIHSTLNQSYVYYSQTGSPYGSYPLPIQNGEDGQKCTISSAGCGPTTAAMIISSYVDTSQTPPVVVDAMEKAGVSISCNGSGMWDLYEYMSKVKGLKVSGMISLGDVGAKEASKDMRGYINGGWTLFVLAHHVYGGHYFWVTQVTDSGDVLAYDPAYGSGRSAPINQNAYAPDPSYIYAFGVKKS